MFYTFRVQKLVDIALGGLILLAAVLLVNTALSLRPTAAAPAETAPTLVIDAGHGGIDGGAVAFDGTKESDINLAIALKLEKLTELWGQESAMTRTDDSRRTDILSYSEHEDLVHRTEIINAVKNGVLISIHQNFYPTSQPSGAQVLYASDEQSRSFGVLTHDNIVSFLQPQNRRLAEPASPKLYITSNVTCPAILVECGFLSNGTDLEMLCSDQYQTSFAVVLLSSYLQFIHERTFT